MHDDETCVAVTGEYLPAYDSLSIARFPQLSD
jgi:hypothetical protein